MARWVLNVFILIFLLVGCDSRNEDNDCFNGKISIISDSISLKKLKAESFTIEGVYNGPIFVYDSLLFYYPLNRTSTSFYEIYNLKDSTLIGRFCNKGGGPDEVMALTMILHVYEENSELKTLLYGGNEKKLIEWNISKSLLEHKTVFDRISSYDWAVDSHVTIYNNIFRLNKDTILAITPTMPITLDQELVSLPLYEKRTIDTNEKVQSYSIFHKYPESNNVSVRSSYNTLSPERFLTSFNCVKPDQTKMVQVMMFIPQINILDLNSGVVEGFRMDASVDFSIFKKNIEKVGYCYTNVTADDNFIYALYWKGKLKDEKETKAPCFVHVFNWQGDLVNKIDLGIYVNQICLDRKNNLLYGREYSSDYIYTFDLNEL